jgi:hypothetical protein
MIPHVCRLLSKGSPKTVRIFVTHFLLNAHTALKHGMALLLWLTQPSSFSVPSPVLASALPLHVLLAPNSSFHRFDVEIGWWVSGVRGASPSNSGGIVSPRRVGRISVKALVCVNCLREHWRNWTSECGLEALCVRCENDQVSCTSSGTSLDLRYHDRHVWFMEISEHVILWGSYTVIALHLV